jgi:hypothetical protein
MLEELHGLDSSGLPPDDLVPRSPGGFILEQFTYLHLAVPTIFGKGLLHERQKREVAIYLAPRQGKVPHCYVVWNIAS